MVGRKGAVASLTSVAKLPFTYQDGIPYTFPIVPAALGKQIQYLKPTLSACWIGISTTKRMSKAVNTSTST
ncbi:hypothetical protein ACNKHW_19760 [Shigella flexneri]